MLFKGPVINNCFQSVNFPKLNMLALLHILYVIEGLWTLRMYVQLNFSILYNDISNTMDIGRSDL